MTLNLRFRQKIKKSFLVATLVLGTLGTNGCNDSYWNTGSSLDKVKSKNEIVILTLANPLTYSISQNGEGSGIDHDLLTEFAKQYDLKLRFVVLPDEESLLKELSSGRGDLGAARLAVPNTQQKFLVGPSYEETHLSLYCHVKEQIENIYDLKGKRISVAKQSDWNRVAPLFKEISHLHIDMTPKKSTSSILAEVNSRRSACAVLESLNADFYNRANLNIDKIVDLGEPYSLSWMFASTNNEILPLVRSWFQRASRDDEIMRVLERYKGSISELDRTDIRGFFNRIKNTLPKFEKTFIKAAEEHDLPWKLIASVAYQESHWEIEAKSFTGVRGLMQLTSETADHLGVKNRNDPNQSIWGGTKYLRLLLDQMPKSLNSKDRLSLALAAYNIGLAHLRDAQQLAEKMGYNPNSWRHLKLVLPLLADPDYAEDLKFGSARGHETVQFVERVTSFFLLMSHKT